MSEDRKRGRSPNENVAKEETVLQRSAKQLLRSSFTKLSIAAVDRKLNMRAELTVLLLGVFSIWC